MRPESYKWRSSNLPAHTLVAHRFVSRPLPLLRTFPRLRPPILRRSNFPSSQMQAASIAMAPKKRERDGRGDAPPSDLGYGHDYDDGGRPSKRARHEVPQNPDILLANPAVAAGAKAKAGAGAEGPAAGPAKEAKGRRKKAAQDAKKEARRAAKVAKASADKEARLAARVAKASAAREAKVAARVAAAKQAEQRKKEKVAKAWARAEEIVPYERKVLVKSGVVRRNLASYGGYIVASLRVAAVQLYLTMKRRFGADVPLHDLWLCIVQYMPHALSPTRAWTGAVTTMPQWRLRKEKPTPAVYIPNIPGGMSMHLIDAIAPQVDPVITAGRSLSITWGPKSTDAHRQASGEPTISLRAHTYLKVSASTPVKIDDGGSASHSGAKPEAWALSGDRATKMSIVVAVRGASPYSATKKASVGPHNRTFLSIR